MNAVRPDNRLVPSSCWWGPILAAAWLYRRGFEPLQQERRVLQFVETDGRIARREEAEVCRISGPQAYRLLDRLAERGLLAREGKRGREVGYISGRI